MSSDLDLDPKEVLMHLVEMGYCNITTAMLDDFISDLQRLIIYEANKKKKKKKKTAAALDEQNEENSTTVPNTTDESTQLSPPSPPPPPPPTLQRKHRHHTGGLHWKETEEVSSSSSESSLAPARRVLRECTKRIASKNQEKENVIKDKASDHAKVAPRQSKSCDCLWRRIGCKCCEENNDEQGPKTRPTKENLAPPRPKSSFIRTWQLTGQPRPGSAPQRSDPVALYHHYQQLWKQQKLPGEARHNDLRWTIREKLLGQEPQPRSCCCCCPCQMTDSAPSETNKSLNIISRGPFTVDGCVTGPFKLNKDGEFTIEDRHLTGFFKLSGGSESDDKSEPEKPYLEDKIKNKQDRVECLLEDAVEKITLSCDKGKKRTGETTDHNGNQQHACRSNHDSKTCKYCSWIHYMLNHKEQQPGQNQLLINDDIHEYERFQADVNTNSTSAQSNKCHCNQRVIVTDKCVPTIFPKLPSNLQCSQVESNQNRFSNSETPSKKGYWLERFKNSPANQLTLSSKKSYWPQTFSEAPVHSTDKIVPSKGTHKEYVTSDLLSRVRNDLNVGNTQNPTQNSHNCVDNCFETRVPITLKDVHGEVVTEVKMKDKKTDRPSHSSTKPLMSVATHVRLHKM